MPDIHERGPVSMWRKLHLAPSRAPDWLDRLALVCLRAEQDDSRLGDLSEQYVLTYERVRKRLGDASWAIVASRLAADLGYLLATGNVALFARIVDPGVSSTENGVAAFIALDLRERIMSMLRTTVTRLMLPALLLVCSALLVNSAIEVWRTWRQNEALMVSLQREKAEAAAQRIAIFMREIERQIGWVTHAQWAKLPIEERRFDYVRLMRLTPAVSALTHLDGQGHELLAVSRLAMDVVGSGIDRSTTPAFVEATANRIYWGPVRFERDKPHVTVALAHGLNSGVSIAEVNIAPLWELIEATKVGESGYAYVVDRSGRLIAYRDAGPVKSRQDLSALPQVAAALKGPPSTEALQAKTFDAKVPGTSVLSAHAPVPLLGWHVFVDLPSTESGAAFWPAVIRGSTLLLLGLLAALFAIRVAVRPIAPSRPLPA